jgi:NTE family protein
MSKKFKKLTSGKSGQHIALVLQGGGALGAYQAGVYEGLLAHGIFPNQVAGISIGAINAALIVGNKRSEQVAALRGFWKDITCPPMDWPNWCAPSMWTTDARSKMESEQSAWQSLLFGRANFFEPEPALYGQFLALGTNRDVGLYSARPLKATLEKWIDFDRLNASEIQCSVGAVNVKTGNFVYFDNRKTKLTPDHIMASGALPPAFTPVEIDGEKYWDGGLVSNTPLSEVIGKTKKDTLVFQVDLWSARGECPKDLAGVLDRMKDIQYSSKTRAITDLSLAQEKHKAHVRKLLEKMPISVRKEAWWIKEHWESQGATTKIIQLIYKEKAYEQHYKDYDFSAASMKMHWDSGVSDVQSCVGFD